MLSKEAKASVTFEDDGREKMAIDDVVGKVLTISEAKLVHGKKGDYVRIVVEEFPEFYINGGSGVKSLYQAGLDLGGDLVGERIRFTEKVTTKSGNSYWRVELVNE